MHSWDTEEVVPAFLELCRFSQFCLLVEDKGLADQCILAVWPGFISVKKTQIIGQPVPLGLAGFHYSVLQSGT